MTDEVVRVITKSLEMLPPYQTLIDNFKTKEGDVVIVGPPKCGTTWLCQIVHQLRTGGDEELTDLLEEVPIFNSVPVMMGYPLTIPQRATPNLFRSHELCSVRLNDSNLGKVIFCSRDPCDSALSWIRFMHDWYRDPDLSQDFIIRMSYWHPKWPEDPSFGVYWKSLVEAYKLKQG